MNNDNRFGHLKKRGKLLTADEFAAGAKPHKEYNRKIKQKIPKEKTLLTIAGKMNRSEDCEKSYQIFLRNDIKNDIDRYCIGNMQSLINYLVRRGLDSIISKGKTIIEENM